MSDNVIRLTDLIEQRLRKQQEIEYYLKALKELESRIKYLQKEVDITTLIIELIENDKILSFEEKQEKFGTVINLIDKKVNPDE
jgi:hypothetical protein